MYDLINNTIDPNLYELEKITVMTPYINELFFQNLFAHLEVDKSAIEKVFVVDQNCSQKNLEDLLNEFPDAKLRISKTDGIVHSKLYYLRFRNKTNGKKRRILIVGSLNATTGGWEKNAETYACVNFQDVENETRSSIKEYVRNLEKSQSVQALICEISGVLIFVPACKLIDYVKSDESDIDFDAWLQRGRLGHEYKAENLGFLSIEIDAKGQSKTANGAWSIQNNRRITKSYIEDIVANANSISDDDESKWKVKYSIETNYGIWVSEQCYFEKSDVFKKKDSNKRSAILLQISKLKSINIKSIVSEAIDKLKMEHSKGTWIGKQLRIVGNNIDETYYENHFKKQINKQVAKSKDKEFCRRVVNGWSFSEMPPIRMNSALWDEFKESFLVDVNFKVSENRERCYSNIARVFRNFMYENNDVDFEDYDEFCAFIEDRWNSEDSEFKEDLIEYFRNEDG